MAVTILATQGLRVKYIRGVSFVCDVAIIGGGPAGSTVGTLLRKYDPSLKVAIFEREKFPRDHVGESQLPVVSVILDEMGAWGKVEAANFPIKIGATYRWGKTDNLWDFEFLADGKFDSEPRPGKYAGQRTATAFQVDRSVYDEILLNHARSLGCIVREETAVRTVLREGDRVQGLTLEDGTEVQARYYVDASGHSGLLRRTMGVEIDSPTALHNIAIWDYWRNADWAVSLGVGGTRIQVLSLPYGWIWFIPLGPDRTSIGLVIPAKYFKEQGRKPEDLYREAITSDAVVSHLIRNATCENKLSTTKDWSFVSERLTGENWFLAGESAGFADPILSAGLSLAHTGARDVAYVILAMNRGEFEAEWLRDFYCSSHRAQIRQHVMFADFWYTANGVFTDIPEFAREIAKTAGLNMTAAEAWQWLGQGGFIERRGGTEVGGFGLLITKEIMGTFTDGEVHYQITGKTHFQLDLEGAEKEWMADMAAGRITRRRAYRRGDKVLPMIGMIGWLAQVLRTECNLDDLTVASRQYLMQNRVPESGVPRFWSELIKSLEALVSDGWVTTRVEPGAAPMPPPGVDFSALLHENRDTAFLLTDR